MEKRAWQKELEEMTDERLNAEIESIQFDMDILRPSVERSVSLLFGNAKDDEFAEHEISEEHLAEYRSLRNRKKYAKKLLKQRAK